MSDSESQRGMSISVADACSDELLAAVEALLPQLSPGAGAPPRDHLEQIIRSQTTDLVVARLDGQIVGMLTLAVFAIPTGTRAWIEDVVVSPDARGRGIGDALTREGIALARRRGAQSVDLTSRPAREAANRLYRRLGFEERTTNVYRLTLEHND